MKANSLLSLLLSLCIFSSAHAVLNVGIPAFDPPYVYSTNEGFVVSLIQGICKRLNETCHLVSMNYDQLFAALNNGKINLVIGGIFIKPSDHYLFSLPYTMGQSQFFTLKASAIHQISDLTGTTIGVVKNNPEGNLFIDYLTKHFANQFKIIEYNSANNLLEALTSHSIAAAFIRRSTVLYWEQNSSGLFKGIGPIVNVGSGIGIMSTWNNAGLIQQINRALQQMENDNSYLTLYRTYFGK